MIQNNVTLNHNLIRFIELFVEYGICRVTTRKDLWGEFIEFFNRTRRRQ